MRPDFKKIYMNLAISLSERSTCKRLSVGCVVTSVDHCQIYGIGYNGNAKGLENTCARDEPGNCGCIHAEDNALLKVNMPSYVEKIAYVTDQPCEYCAKRIINKGGFVKVVYNRPYRDDTGLKILKQAGIEIDGPGDPDGSELSRAKGQVFILEKEISNKIVLLERYTKYWLDEKKLRQAQLGLARKALGKIKRCPYDGIGNWMCDMSKDVLYEINGLEDNNKKVDDENS